MDMQTTYGLCQHHIDTARTNFKCGQFTHDSLMRHLKQVYDGRKRIHDSLHSKDQ